MNARAPVLKFQPKPQNYGDGYRAGLADGERWAGLRLFWLGVAAGVLMAGIIVLAVVISGSLR